MKVLLDENLPHELRHLLVGHDVATVTYQGWSGLKNGVLMRTAADGGFDVMITMDNGVEFQQNLRSLPLAVLIVSANSNDIDDLRLKVPQILAALATMSERAVIRV